MQPAFQNMRGIIKVGEINLCFSLFKKRKKKMTTTSARINREYIYSVAVY